MPTEVTARVPAASDWRLGRHAETARGEVAYDVFGEGDPVVLVHGTPSWSYLWRNVVPPLAERFSVHVFDLLGYGDSPASPDVALSLATHAETLVELLDRWQLEEPAIAGHDIGGGIVMRAHLAHGRPFRRIALLDAVVLTPWVTATTRHIKKHLDVYRTMPNHIFTEVASAHLRTAVHRSLGAEAVDAYMRPWRGEHGQAAYLHKVEHFDEADTKEFEPRLGQVTVPVRIVWGEEDAWLEPATAERIRERIPEAELSFVPGAGHFLMEDAPEALTRELLEFFGR